MHAERRGYRRTRWLHGVPARLALQTAPSIAVIAAAVSIILVIGFSRLYLGVHYFSDVVAGYAAGVVWVSACISGAEIARRKREMAGRGATGQPGIAAYTSAQ
ncbi:MAG: phosphatase PAP2 family protein [Gemmatimonadaceae bacterium]|nr:phosphatase PAP2 family protein [Gemmatimonadaceae bacterium]